MTRLGQLAGLEATFSFLDPDHRGSVGPGQVTAAVAHAAGSNPGFWGHVAEEARQRCCEMGDGHGELGYTEFVTALLQRPQEEVQAAPQTQRPSHAVMVRRWGA